jgi:hypothetical protein
VSRATGGKLHLNENEAGVIDLVRGDLKRAAWIRETTLAVAYGDEEMGPSLPTTSTPSTERRRRRTVQIALDFAPAERAAIDRVRGGVGLGTWVRDTALRQAAAILLARGES